MVDFAKEFNPARVEEVRIGPDDENRTQLRVKFKVPVPGFASPATMQEIFCLEEGKNALLVDAVHQLYRIIQEVIQRGDNVSDDPCSTCNSPCCSIYSHAITLTDEDVARISSRGYGPEHFNSALELGPVWHYTVATKEVDGQDCCVFFDTKQRRCGIHGFKPQVCRDFPAHLCDHHEPASEQVVRLRRKTTG
jgi:Fe-S-cluster containining protein